MDAILHAVVGFDMNPTLCAYLTLYQHIPQGQVLNQTSAWWMEATRHIVGNALLSVPDPNVSIMRACTVFPVEFVVRGFMTGAGPAAATGIGP